MKDMYYPYQALIEQMQSIHNTAEKRAGVTPREVESIYLGLINSIHWMVLRYIEEERKHSASTRLIETFTTERYFASKWMRRNEIVDRIENTSGINQRLSHLSLLIVETLILETIMQGYWPSLSHIGRFRTSLDSSIMSSEAEDLNPNDMLRRFAHEWCPPGTNTRQLIQRLEARLQSQVALSYTIDLAHELQGQLKGLLKARSA